MYRHRKPSVRVILHAAAAAAATAAMQSAIVAPARAQTTIAYSSGTYSQNFDTLPSSGTLTFGGAGPFDLSAAPANATGMPGWQLARTVGADATLIGNAGNTTTGAAYSYGAIGDAERALGSLASGSSVHAFGAVFVNTSAATLNSFTVNFTMEQWRNGGSGNVNTLGFAYALGGSDIVSGTFTPASSLDAASVINASGAGSLNGNDAANRASVGGTVSGLKWLPGQSLVIRWSDTDDGGSDSGVAIDDLTFSAIGGARSLTWNPAGAGGTVWNTSPANTNWLDGATPASFANGDVANFTDVGVGIVETQGTLEPGATHFANESGAYTLVGTGIGGSGAVVKTGDGTVRFDLTNTYSGGTVVNDGVLLIGGDGKLGAPSGGVTLGGGTLASFGPVISSRTVTLTDATVSTLNASGVAPFTFAAVTGTGSLRKIGSATLTVTGGYSVGGTTSILAGTVVLGQNSGSVNLSATTDNDWAGHLVIANGIRVNFNSGNFTGGGSVRVRSSGAILSTTGALINQTPTIGNNILLNSDNVAGPFVTTLGATAQNTLTIGGVISGNSDLIFSSSTAGAGSGVIVLNNSNTYAGATTISNATAGVVRLGAHDGLPATTDLTFGTGTTSAGALDLAGFNQSVRSLRSDTSGNINGIANTGAALSTFTVTGSATTTFAGTIGVPNEVSNLPGANANIALVLSPTHTGQLTLAAANNHTGGTTVQSGRLVTAHASALGAGPLVVSGGTVQLAPALGAPVTLPAIDVSGAGRVDIADNPVVVDYDGASPLGDIRDDIASAYAGGAWTGPGITSGGANATQFAVGYAEASSLATVPAIFGAVDSTAVLLRLTRAGDATLDGLVNLSDFNRLAANFGVSGAVWSQGDFTYDGIVNLADFNRLAANFGLSAGPDGVVDPEDWAALASAVPEPAGLAMLALMCGTAALRHRRRRAGLTTRRVVLLHAAPHCSTPRQSESASAAPDPV